MEIESEYLDESFDGPLNNIDKLVWLPWVGKKYSSSDRRTLILGESVYDWNPSDSKTKELIVHRNNTRRLQVEHGFRFKRKSKFVRNFERAFYNKRSPSVDEKCMLWSSSIYHNLVLRMMKNKKERPSYKDYYEGWEVVNSLISVLDIDRAIVYGLERKKLDALRDLSREVGYECEIEKHSVKVGRSYPRIATLATPKKNISLLFIRHPSSYFSWKKWAPIIQYHFR